MRFLVDANLPRALVRWMAEGGDEAAYVDDVLAPPATDDAIWDFANANELIIVSKDADFAARAVREEGVRVVWVRCGNLKLATFRVWFDVRVAAMNRLIDLDERVIELR